MKNGVCAATLHTTKKTNAFKIDIAFKIIIESKFNNDLIYLMIILKATLILKRLKKKSL
jgi:hypothetical protein